MKPTDFPLRRFAAVALLAAATFSGCDDRRAAGSALETEDPNFKEGKRLVDEQKGEAALECFTKVILSHTSAPESHLESGNLCLDSLKDPLGAIFHFRQYIKQSTGLSARRIGLIDGRIRAAEREFLRDPRLPFKPAEGAGSGDEALLEQIKALRIENDGLKRRQAELVAAAAKPAPAIIRPDADTSEPDRVIAPPVTPRETAPVAPTATTRKYVVVSGDTLSKISRKVYNGNGSQWPKIVAANPDKLPSAKATLKIGMELKIPD